MDLATLIGFIGAVGIVAAAMIFGGNALVFINVPSLLIVVGGSLMVVLMKFTLAQFLGSVKVALKTLFNKMDTPEELISKSVELVETSRKGGLLSLENVEINNSFLKKGVQLLVDGHSPEIVREMLDKDIQQTLERHTVGKKVFIAMGDVAPAMGMIGTLIGLVQMLSTMDDPKTIGPAMAVALLTTLYGSMIANMIALPIADKLALRSAEEKQQKDLMIDAIVAIQRGQNPRVVEDTLKNYLPVSKRDKVSEEGGGQQAAQTT